MSSNINTKAIFKKICDDSKEHTQKKKQNPTVQMLLNSDFGKKKKSELDKFEAFIKDHLANEFGDEKLMIKSSIGESTLAYIPWIIIGMAREGDNSLKASKGRYVAICFSHNGKGAVAGFAMAASDNNNEIYKNTAIKRSTKPNVLLEGNRIDVDTLSKHKTQYFNNLFFNPKEFFSENFNEQEFIDHLNRSIQLYLNENKSNREYFSLKLGAGVKNNEIPEDFQKILSRSKETITISEIINLDPKKGDIAFLVLAGGKHGPTDWNNKAVFSIVEILKKHSQGYDPEKPRHYKIDIKTLMWFPENLNYPFFPNRDIIIFGGRNIPNQSLASLSNIALQEKERSLSINRSSLSEQEQKKTAQNFIKDICNYIIERHPETKDKIYSIFPEIDFSSASNTNISEEIENINEILSDYRRLILYGPPGTGKTFYSEQIKNQFDESQLIVFHPSYGYEDFIGCYRPTLNDGTHDVSNFQIEDSKGIFVQLCEKASVNKDKRYLLIIDEINRGDIARIFGELLYAIEAKENDREVILSYNNAKITIPNNIYIIGTMNTADKSISLLDVALRRRFAFLAITPKTELIQKEKLEGVNLRGLFNSINEKIKIKRGNDYMIGHAYFLHPVRGNQFNTIQEFKIAWETRIVPLLLEYFNSNYDAVYDILGNSFIKNLENSDDEMPIYDMVKFETIEQFINALKEITHNHIENNTDIETDLNDEVINDITETDDDNEQDDSAEDSNDE